MDNKSRYKTANISKHHFSNSSNAKSANQLRVNEVNLFCQINMQKSKQGALDLVTYLGGQTSSSQHISLIQEPYCYENRVCFLRKTNMDLLYFDTKDKHQPPRTAIYASKRANLMMLPQLTSRDCVAALWMQANGHSVVVCSLLNDR